MDDPLAVRLWLNDSDIMLEVDFKPN